MSTELQSPLGLKLHSCGVLTVGNGFHKRLSRQNLMIIIPVLWFLAHVHPVVPAAPLCDGISDDTAALQANIDSTGFLEIPSNRTCLSQPLRFPSNFKLVIKPGGILKAGKKWLDGRSFLSAYNCTNITIVGTPGGAGGTIDGSGSQW